MTRVRAIIGGGPGGLMTARLLERRFGHSCQPTLLEATDRVGGKVQTVCFDSAPATYEAGVAECYAYDAIGHDPLRQLITELGLTTVATHGRAVVLNGTLLRNDEGIRKHCGERTLRAIEDFRQQAAAMLPLASWYRGVTPRDNAHPWAHCTCEEILDQNCGSGCEALSEDRRTQRHGDGAASDQWTHRAEEHSQVSAK